MPQTLSKPHTVGESQVSGLLFRLRRILLLPALLPCALLLLSAAVARDWEARATPVNLFQSTTYPFDSSAGGTSCHRPKPLVVSLVRSTGASRSCRRNALVEL